MATTTDKEQSTAPETRVPLTIKLLPQQSFIQSILTLYSFPNLPMGRIAILGRVVAGERDRQRLRVRLSASRKECQRH